MPERLPGPGDREDQRREFKAAEILRAREGRKKVVKEIVGMLNAGGGSIYVGIQEQAGGLFQGYDLLSRETDQFHLDSLKDQLLDSVEPRLDLDQCCPMEWIPYGSGFVLEIRARPPEDFPPLPYHVLEGGSRWFGKRLGDRLRPFNTMELLEMKGTASKRTKESFDSWFQGVADQLDQRPWYLLGLRLREPGGSTGFPLPAGAVDLINSPPREMIREAGWNFTTAFGGSAHWSGMKHGAIESGTVERDFRLLRVDAKGRFWFRTLLEHLQSITYEGALREHEAQGMLYPLGLLETTVSLHRLAARVWQQHLGAVAVEAKLVLANGREWLLPPGHPAPSYFSGWGGWRKLGSAWVETEIHRREGARFRDHPDDLAYQLIRDVYDAAGYQDEKAIPFFQGEPKRFVPPG